MIDERHIRPSGAIAARPATWWNDEAVGEVGRAPFVLAQELSALLPGLADEKDAFEAMVVAALLAANQGSSRLPLDPGVVARLLAPCVDDAPSLAADAVRVVRDPKAATVVGSPGSFLPLIIDGDWLYSQRLLLYEERLAGALRARIGRPFFAWGEATLNDALADLAARPTRLPGGEAMTLSAEQRYAILTALHLPLSIITGGPGTGKTSIVVSLLRLLARLGIEPDSIALAAPTGKAAHRLGESIDAQLESLDDPASQDQSLRASLASPRTLHRLLEYSPSQGTFRRSADFPVNASVVIVDEASMIDLVLMERLSSAVADDARLILLGDAEQLPSVETGTVLRDLIPDATSTETPWRHLVPDLEERHGEEATSRHAVRLTTSYRMSESNIAGSAVLRVAESIRSGRADDAVAALGELEDGGVLLRPIDHEDERERRSMLRDFADSWYDEHIGTLPHRDQVFGSAFPLVEGEFSAKDEAVIDDVFAHLQTARILCLTRVWATGADALNVLFHGRLAREMGFEGVAPDYLPGDLVLMQRNDYERGLFNGDQGLIVNVTIGEDTKPMVVFPEGHGYRAHHLPALRGQLDHAFAMTVHKAQGSEFDEVAVILPDEEIPLLTRELLYTGITRCRRKATVVGTEQMFRIAVERPIARFTGVRERLSSP